MSNPKDGTAAVQSTERQDAAPDAAPVHPESCHAKGGRLDQVKGIYIPGRDGNPLVNTLGWLAAGGALCGISLHGLIRFLRRKQ